MLHRLERLERDLYQEKILVHEATAEAQKVAFSASKKQAEKLLKGGASPAEVAELLRREPLPTPPQQTRYVVNDATVEKLGEILQDNPEGVLLFRDELVGWLRSLDRDGREGDRAFYLEAWTGAKPFTYDRIGRGTVFIDSVTVAMLGGIQPGPLRQYVSGALAGGAGDDGLLQRFQLLVWPDVKSGWHNVDRWPDTEAKQAVWSIFERLAKLAPHHEESEVPCVRFSEDAQAAFDTWRAGLEHRLRNEAMPAVLEAHLGKFRSLVPSLALIFHLADESLAVSPVRLGHLTRAIAWAGYLESHARRVYSQALDPAMAAAIALDAKLDALPEVFTARDVYRNGWAGLDREPTDKALAVLLEFGHVIEDGDSRSTGRPTARYRVNPKLKNFSEFLRRGTDKTDKSTESGGFGSFGSTMNQDYENIFSEDDLLDGEA